MDNHNFVRAKFLIEIIILIEFVGCILKVKEAKAAIKALTEANQEKKQLIGDLEGNRRVASGTRKLFREGNKSKLIELGVALIAIPEPTPVTPIVGSSLVVVGAVHKGIRSRAAFAEDIGKDLKKALKDISHTKDLI